MASQSVVGQAPNAFPYRAEFPAQEPLETSCILYAGKLSILNTALQTFSAEKHSPSPHDESQKPVFAALQVLPLKKKLSTGQSAEVPEQLSAISQVSSNCALHSVPPSLN
jgi:hypothetical protein